MSNITDPIGGRKFALCLITEIITAALVYLGKLDHGAYTTITLAVIGGYITGNVIQKVQLTKNENGAISVTSN